MAKKSEMPAENAINAEAEIVNFKEIEEKWQKRWEEEKIFEVKEDAKKEKYYVLEMYPYPSGSGLHIGHAFNYIIGDILARFMRMKGFNVLYPMGYDSFGLPAENAAIKNNSHPKIYTDRAIEKFIRQQKALGLSYDWTRKIQSHDINYYKWDQYFFLQLLKKELVYRKKSPVNWCSKCSSVLANEQVHNGKCWVHKDTEITINHLEQWFVRTTEYSDELLEKVGGLDWPERIKAMQKNWIGKSQGIEINFKINGQNWPVFTTRPDTIYGVTFMVVSAQHPKLMELVIKEQKKEVDNLMRKIKSTSEKDANELEKEGAFTGSYAVNPVTGDKVPVYAGNFVVADYGSGMVMAVPAHDQRDLEFAKKYGIQVKEVIKPAGEGKYFGREKAFTDEGILINSEKFNGIQSKEAIEKISEHLESKRIGKRVVNYKLRDWLISRQRYWGAPIPIVYCEKCGAVPVPEKELPVVLPEDVKFGAGNPLSTSKSFIEAKCPKCKGKARRETDTMDTFFDSSWYYLRFCDASNNGKPFSKKKAEYWMPVDFYVGGAEHACMHLIYARFFTKALRDMGFLKFDEPFKKLFNQGMIHGEDGAVMSKSRGNVIDPLSIIDKYGADSLRLFLISMASPDKDFSWSIKGFEGSLRLIQKIYGHGKSVKFGKSSEKLQHKLNKAIREVSANIRDIKYNTAVINLRELFEFMQNEKISTEDYNNFLKIMSPFIPHIAEELWGAAGNKGFISLAKWPDADESRINEKFEEAEKASEKIVSDILNILSLIKQKTGGEGNKIYLYVIPNEIGNYDANALSKRVQKEVAVYAVNDKQKHDPEGKAGKTKLGKPGIYVE